MNLDNFQVLVLNRDFSSSVTDTRSRESLGSGQVISCLLMLSSLIIIIIIIIIKCNSILATILHCKCVVTGPGFGKVISFGTMCNSPVFLNFWYDAGFLVIMISAVIFLVCLASVSVHFYACTLDAFLACT